MTFGSVEVFAVGKRVVVNQVQLDDDESFVKDAIIIERRGEFVSLRFSDGVRLKWSIDSLSIYLTVEEQYTNKINGLCGDYNDEKKNDFLLPDRSYTNEVSIFANNWRMDSSVII